MRFPGYVHDTRGRLGCQLIAEWGGIDLFALAVYDPPIVANGLEDAAQNDIAVSGTSLEMFDSIAASESPYFLQFPIKDDPGQGDIWSLEEFVTNWVLHINIRYLSVAQVKRSSRRRRFDPVEWLRLTHTVADEARVVLGDGLSQRMHQLADDVETIVAWPASRFKKPPHDPRGLAELYLSAHLWAFDQFRAAMTLSREAALTGKGASSGALTPVLEALVQAGFDGTKYEALQMKILRLEKRIRPGQRDNLMSVKLKAV